MMMGRRNIVFYFFLNSGRIPQKVVHGKELQADASFWPAQLELQNQTRPGCRFPSRQWWHEANTRIVMRRHSPPAPNRADSEYLCIFVRILPLQLDGERSRA